MDAADCHAQAHDEAKVLIRRTLGVRRVADWCAVSEDAVYQWLSRGTPERPIPPQHVAKIVAGARRAGIEVEAQALWPELAR